MTRGATAAMLTRGFGYPASDVDRFVDDDGHMFEAEIQAIAAVGVTLGCNPPVNNHFCPDDMLLRDAMASFLASLGVGYAGHLRQVERARDHGTVG